MTSIVVVGAGIAGLTAAYRLSRGGAHVTVLEANPHVGGRMSTELFDGYRIDRGAQFLSDGYSVISSLITETGLHARVQRASGWTGIVRDGVVRRVNARYPWSVASSGLLSWRDTMQVAAGSVHLAGRTALLPLSDYSRWQKLDDTDAADWAARHFGNDALDFVVEPMLEGLYFQSARETSAAWAAIAWSFGLRGNHVTTLAGGIGMLPETLARELNVRLSTPVSAIETGAEGVVAHTADGPVRGEYLILATTSGVARRLYRTARDVDRSLLSTPYAAAINVSISISGDLSAAMVPADVYGVLIPRAERRVIASIGIESRKCSTHVPSGEMLNVMLNGDAAARLLDASDDSIRAETLAELSRYFPRIDAAIAFVRIFRWAEGEPLSPVGRCRNVDEYRRTWHPGIKVTLAGDYMGIPCTEGAAESGAWAAAKLLGAASLQTG